MQILIILITGVVAAIITYELGTVRNKSAIRASAITGLIFGLPAYFMPAINITQTGLETIPLAAMGASFVGMSSGKVLPSRFWVALGGAIFSAIFISSSPVFSGNGGGLGISALVAVIIILGLKRTLAGVSRKR